MVFINCQLFGQRVLLSLWRKGDKIFSKNITSQNTKTVALKGLTQAKRFISRKTRPERSVHTTTGFQKTPHGRCFLVLQGISQTYNSRMNMMAIGTDAAPT